MSNILPGSLYKYAARWCATSVARLVAAALPRTCALCGTDAGPDPLCGGCAAAVTNAGPACPRCALPSSDGRVCAGCRSHPPAFDAALSGSAYDFPMANLVRRLKYGSALELVPAIAAPLVVSIERTRADRCVDALVAMPLAPARQRERGYNQAREIAAEIRRATGLPLWRGLDRIVAGPPQASLPWRARASNVRGAFVARRRFDGERIALVDDVLTTGSTAAAAASALARAGARRVEVWVAARTPPGRRA